MKIEKEKKHKIDGDKFLIIPSKVNKNKLAKLYGMLSSIYRNPIGSIVREYVSNALDANNEAYNFKTLSLEELIKNYSWIKNPVFNMTDIEISLIKLSLSKAEKDDPVIISIKNNEFHIRDFGIGMSPERMTHVFFNYLDSTKEDTNKEIGGFGIGAKSALSYVNTFYIDTIYKGIKYNYIMTKDDFDIPQGQLLFTSSTTENNGTLIRIPINNNDHHKFVRASRLQLTYIDNLYIDDPNKKYWLKRNVYFNENQDENNFKIIKGKGWLYRPYSVYTNMHICLNKITYTIDWIELGRKEIYFPIALKFNTGELIPTPSRENIVYTDKAKDIINKRIDDIKEYFYALYQEKIEPTEDVNTYLKKKHIVINTIEISGFEIDITGIINKDNLTGVRFKPFVDIGYTPSKYGISLNHIFRYKGLIEGKKGSINIYKDGYAGQVYYETLNDTKNNILQIEETDYITKKKVYFILEKYYNKKDIILIEYKKIGLQKFKDILNLHNYSKDRWMIIIKTFVKHFRNYFKHNIKNKYSDYIIDPNWERTYSLGKSYYSKNKNESVNIEDNNISCNWYNSYTNKLQRSYLELDSLPKTLIYAKSEDKIKIESLGDLLYDTRGYRHTIKRSNLFKLVTLSKKNYEIIKKMNNTTHIDDVFKGKLPVFKNIVTARFIIDRFKDVEFLYHLNCPFNNEIQLKVKEVYGFIDRYTRKNDYKRINIYKSFLNDCFQIAAEYNLFNNNIIKVLEDLEEYTKGIEILKYTTAGNIPEDELIAFLRKNNKKIDNYYYLKKEFKEKYKRK